MTHNTSANYWISPTALQITPNALDDPDRIMASCTGAAQIVVWMQGVIDYDDGHNYRRWPLAAYPTVFTTTSAKYVYVAIPHSIQIGNTASVVFPSEYIDVNGYALRDTDKKDDEGKVIQEEVLVGDGKHWYIFLGGILSASVDADGVITPRELTGIDYGYLDSSLAINAGPIETDWYRYEQQKGLVTFKKDLDLLRDPESGQPVVGFDIMRIGDALLEWDRGMNALRLKNAHSDRMAHFATTGDVSAFGIMDAPEPPHGAEYFRDLLDIKALAFGSADEGKTVVWDGTKWIKGNAGGGDVSVKWFDIENKPTTLEGYGVKAEVDDLMSGCLKSVSWDDLQTKPTQAQLTSIIGDAYLTEHQSLAGYVTKPEFTAEVRRLEPIDVTCLLNASGSIAITLDELSKHSLYASIRGGLTPVQLVSTVHGFYLVFDRASEVIAEDAEYESVERFYITVTERYDDESVYVVAVEGSERTARVGLGDDDILALKEDIDGKYIKVTHPTNEITEDDVALLRHFKIVDGHVKIDTDFYSEKGISAYGHTDEDEPHGAERFADLIEVIGTTPSANQVWGWDGTKYAWLTVKGGASSWSEIADRPLWLDQYKTQKPTVGSWVNDMHYITSDALKGYATQDWVNTQGFLTEQSLSAYTKTSDLKTSYVYLNDNLAGNINPLSSVRIDINAFAFIGGMSDAYGDQGDRYYDINNENTSLLDYGNDDFMVLKNGTYSHLRRDEYGAIQDGQTLVNFYAPGVSGSSLEITWDYSADTPLKYRRTIDADNPNNHRLSHLWRAIIDENNLATFVADKSVASASKLSTPRTIWGQSFDGSANVNGDFKQDGVSFKSYNLTLTGKYSPSSVTTGIGHAFVSSYNEGCPIMFLSDFGKVGINNADPQYALDVKGTGYFSDDYNRWTCIYNGAIDMVHNNPHINFHVGGVTRDFDVRIIADKYSNTSVLNVLADELVLRKTNYAMDGSRLRIGNAVLEYDETNKALKMYNADGVTLNMYATGGISAYGTSGDYTSIDSLVAKTLTANEELIAGKRITVGVNAYIKTKGDEGQDLYLGSNESVFINSEGTRFTTDGELYMDDNGLINIDNGKVIVSPEKVSLESGVPLYVGSTDNNHKVTNIRTDGTYLYITINGKQYRLTPSNITNA